MTKPAPLPRILHVHGAFEGAAARRCARLINALADAEHSIVSGDLARRGAAAAIDRKRQVAWPKFPSLEGTPLPGRLKRLAAAMAGYDLVCTYGRGAMNAALAHTLFADVFKLAPLIHHEDGEASGSKRGSTFYRRIAVGRSAALVVPSHSLERLALETWQQPRSRVRLIPDGIDTRAYGKAPKRDALPRLVKRPGELWLGTVAGPGTAAVIRAFSRLAEPWQLVILGQEPAGAGALAQAEACGIEDRVHLAGGVADPAKAIALFDLFALGSEAGQPGPVVEAMAAGLAIVAPRAGDVGALVASDNGPCLGSPGDEAALAEMLARLAGDPALRERIGEANKAKALAEYDITTMIDRYRALYWGVMGRRPA